MSPEFCPRCGHQNENFKDWNSPAFRKIYLALARADRKEPGEDFPDWLNTNGFPNLTCCPECHTDDFTHVEGCKLAEFLDALAKSGPEKLQELEKKMP